MMAGSLLPPDMAEVARMNWNRVSLMKRGLTTAVSVTCIVFSELAEL